MFRVLFLILVVMSSIAFSQTTGIFPCDPNPEAVNFYEIGTTTRLKLKLRLEEYLEKLITEPNSQGYITNYGSDKEIARREKIIRESLAFRKHYSSRITFVRGGNEKIPKTELWIVPSGAIPPVPNYTKTLKSNSIKKTVRILKTFEVNPIGCRAVEKIINLGKFDAFGKVSERYFNWTLKEFAESLQFDKTLKGYVLVYGNDEEINNLEIRIRQSKLLKNVTDEQLIFIKGGFRKEPQTELWIVAEGSKPPKP